MPAILHHARVTRQSGRQATVTIENGRAWISTYDSTLRRLTTASPASRQTVAWFDAQGRMTAVGSGGFAALRLTYDGRGKLTDLVQGPRNWHYGYDSWGRLSTLENAFGHVVEYRYDAADRDTGVAGEHGRLRRCRAAGWCATATTPTATSRG